MRDISLLRLSALAVSKVGMEREVGLGQKRAGDERHR